MIGSYLAVTVSHLRFQSGSNRSTARHPMVTQTQWVRSSWPGQLACTQQLTGRALLGLDLSGDGGDGLCLSLKENPLQTSANHGKKVDQVLGPA